MKHYTLFICLYPDQCELLGKILWDWNVQLAHTYLMIVLNLVHKATCGSTSI